MYYSTVYVGMDVHKENFSLCCYTNEKEEAEYPQKVEAHYSKVLNYLEAMRFHYGDDVLFICGYEAGCLGFTLYHELTAYNVKCVILAPTTMPVAGGKKKIKTDKIITDSFSECKPKNVVSGVLGSAIVAFGVYNIHDVADITEGGILGMNLLLDYWFGISPAYTNIVLTIICFAIGWKVLGKSFFVYSVFFTGGFSLFYRLLESFTPHLFPQLAEHPWLAAVIGCLFVGVGVGISVRAGGAQCGDDALAMSMRHYFGVKLSTVYLCSDMTVLLLSLTYIPLKRILCSLLTVILSGQIIDLVVNAGKKSHLTNT